MQSASGTFASKPRLGLLLFLVVLSVIISDIPILNLILMPLTTFVTAVHEMGHAVACMATGGQVSGMTIVADSEGHGGLTFCHGGLPFIYTQAGYLGSALFGCFLIFLSRYPRLSKIVLFSIGCTICVASVFLMSGAIFHEGRIWQGLGSMLYGMLIGALFIWGGSKLKVGEANLVLLFIAVQTGLNALSGVIFLVELSLGLTGGHTWSDASNMTMLTGIPAFVWAVFWALASIVMLGGTLWYTYHLDKRKWA